MGRVSESCVQGMLTVSVFSKKSTVYVCEGSKENTYTLIGERNWTGSRNYCNSYSTKGTYLIKRQIEHLESRDNPGDS